MRHGAPDDPDTRRLSNRAFRTLVEGSAVDFNLVQRNATRRRGIKEGVGNQPGTDKKPSSSIARSTPSHWRAALALAGTVLGCALALCVVAPVWANVPRPPSRVRASVVGKCSVNPDFVGKTLYEARGLTAKLPAPGQAATSLPWGLQLQGLYCQLLRDPVGSYDGQTVRYGCRGSDLRLLGELDKGHAAWKVRSVRWSGKNYAPGPVETVLGAWYAARSK